MNHSRPAALLLELELELGTIVVSNNKKHESCGINQKERDRAVVPWKCTYSIVPLWVIMKEIAVCDGERRYQSQKACITVVGHGKLELVKFDSFIRWSLFWYCRAEQNMCPNQTVRPALLG